MTLFAQPPAPSAVLQIPDVLAQVFFTPLLALLAIWVGIGVSARTSVVRVAQQLSAITGLPVLLVVYLMSFGLIHVTLGLALGIAALLFVFDGLGWRLVSAAFDRERLIVGRRR